MQSPHSAEYPWTPAPHGLANLRHSRQSLAAGLWGAGEVSAWREEIGSLIALALWRISGQHQCVHHQTHPRNVENTRQTAANPAGTHSVTPGNRSPPKSHGQKHAIPDPCTWEFRFSHHQSSIATVPLALPCIILH
jgi:hypothetical protein